jgi:hypothetical protein
MPRRPARAAEHQILGQKFGPQIRPTNSARTGKPGQASASGGGCTEKGGHEPPFSLAALFFGCRVAGKRDAGSWFYVAINCGMAHLVETQG